jgi:glycosyltransferase involved in cell wall biosynthesis
LSMVYASAPFKGLPLLMKLWPQIKEKIPGIKLHLCTGMSLYDSPDQDAHFKILYDLIKKDPDIINHGVLTNKETVKIIGECTIMCYPNFFPETCCAAALESISQNTPVITSAIGALPETVGDCGVCLPGDPKTMIWQQQFIWIIEDFLKNRPDILKKARIHCINRTIETWPEIIDDINTIIEELMNQDTTKKLINNFESEDLSV